MTAFAVAAARRLSDRVQTGKRAEYDREVDVDARFDHLRRYYPQRSATLRGKSAVRLQNRADLLDDLRSVRAAHQRRKRDRDRRRRFVERSGVASAFLRFAVATFQLLVKVVTVAARVDNAKNVRDVGAWESETALNVGDVVCVVCVGDFAASLQFVRDLRPTNARILRPTRVGVQVLVEDVSNPRKFRVKLRRVGNYRRRRRELRRLIGDVLRRQLL